MNYLCFPASKTFPGSKRQSRKGKKSPIILDQKGQSFLEFILLLFVVLTLSLVMTRGLNNGMGERWKRIVETIVGHELKSPPEIELR